MVDPSGGDFKVYELTEGRRKGWSAYWRRRLNFVIGETFVVNNSPYVDNQGTMICREGCKS